MSSSRLFENLFKKISNNGAVLTEFSSDTIPFKGNFPRRNRIISGLSKGVVVVEAARRSGSLITVDFALEQGREVFAVPGRTDFSTSFGSNKLIQEGAKLVRNHSDILEELNLSIVAPQQLEIKEFSPASETESLVLKQLSSVPVHVDEICRSIGLTIAEVSSTLAILELKGIARHAGNMNYVLSQKVR